MRVIITGGTGFIGYPILNKLISLNHEVMLVGRNFSSVKHLKIQKLKLNLNNYLEKKKEIINFKPEAVIHLAWQGIPNFSKELSEINYNITTNFISFLIKYTDCKKIIIPGSCWEYNDGNILGSCSENMKINPQKPFSICKKKIFDKLIRETKKHKITFNWARLFYVYGPRQKKTSLIPTLIESFSNNKKINIETPYNKNDFIYIDDVVKILIFMLQSKLPSGAYNVGTGIATEVLNLYNIIKNLFNIDYDLQKKFLNKTCKINMHFYANTSKFKKYFKNFEFEKINSGLYKTVKYFKENY